MSCGPNPSSPNLLSFALAVASPTDASAGFTALPAFCLGSVTTSASDDVQRNPFWEVSPVDDAVVNLARGLEAIGALSSTPHHWHPFDLGIDLDRPSADSALNGDPDVGDVSTLFLKGFASIDATTLMSFGIELDGDALINISSTVLPVLRPSLDTGVDTKLVAQVRPATSLVSVFGPSGCVRVSVLLAPCGAAVLTTLMTSPGAFITSAFSRVLAADPYERRSRRLLRQLKRHDLMSYVQRLKAGDVDDERLDSLDVTELYNLGLPVGPRARLAKALGLRTTTYWTLCDGHRPRSVLSAHRLAGYQRRQTASVESRRGFRALECLPTLADIAARCTSTSSVAFAASGPTAADATATAGARLSHVVPTFIGQPHFSCRLQPVLAASSASFEKRCAALPEDVARLCYQYALALCRQPLCAQIRVFAKAVRERDGLFGAWLEGEVEDGEEALRLYFEAWEVSRWWPRNNGVARAHAGNQHVARHAASLLVPQEHGLRGDGPSPDTSNHKASLSPKPPDRVAEDTGEHVSLDAASLLVPQEHGLRGDGPPPPTYLPAAVHIPGLTRVEQARQNLDAAIEAIGDQAFAYEGVTSTLESRAVAYRSKELMKVDPRSSDEMRVLCAAQDGLSASLLERDLEEPLPLTHIKMAYAEWRANDVCLEDLLRGLTRKVEREKDSPSSRQIHVQCLITLNECFKHVASWESRDWFTLVTTKGQSSKVESFAELCTGPLYSSLCRVYASDPSLAEQVTRATKCLDILRELRVVFAHSEHSPRAGAAEARLSDAMLNARNLMCMPPSCLSQHIASSNEKYGSLTFVSVEALLEQLTTGTTADKMIDLRAGQRVQVLSRATDNRSVTGTIYSIEGAHDETCLYVVMDDGETRCVYATEATRPSPGTTSPPSSPNAKAAALLEKLLPQFPPRDNALTGVRTRIASLTLNDDPCKRPAFIE